MLNRSRSFARKTVRPLPFRLGVSDVFEMICLMAFFTVFIAIIYLIIDSLDKNTKI